MSDDTRQMTEIYFMSSDSHSAVMLAAIWIISHPDVAIETVVGDSEYIAVYYTETVKIPKADYGVTGPGTNPFQGIFDIGRYPARAEGTISYLGRAG